MQTGCVRQALTIYGGIGDELLLSAAVHEHRCRGGKPLNVVVSAPELFLNNPDVGKVIRGSQSFLRMAAFLPIKWISPKYPPIESASSEHFIVTICRAAGVRGRIGIRPYVYLSKAEVEAAAFAKDMICIQSSSSAARWPILNKEWGADRYQQLVKLAQGRTRFLQLGSTQDPPLEGALDLRGKTSLRETAAILKASNGLVCNEGLLMHLARAVDRRSLVVYGGRILARHSGYLENINLEHSPPCSPCGKDSECEFNRACLSSITVEKVAEKIMELQMRRHESLEISHANVD